jgi:hypothetical protein
MTQKQKVESFQVAATDAEIRAQFGRMSRGDLVDHLVAAVDFARELIVEAETYKLLAATLVADLPSKDRRAEPTHRIDLAVRVVPESCVEDYRVEERTAEGHAQRWSKTVRPAVAADSQQ